MQFTHQVDIWIYFMHTVLIRSLFINDVIINCKWYDIICSVTIESVNRHCHSEIQSGWTSSWYFKKGLSEFKAFFQPMARVSMCFYHTHIKKGLFLGGRGLTKLRNRSGGFSTFALLPVCLSLYPSELNIFSRNGRDFLQICWNSLRNLNFY